MRWFLFILSGLVAVLSAWLIPVDIAIVWLRDFGWRTAWLLGSLLFALAIWIALHRGPLLLRRWHRLRRLHGWLLVGWVAATLFLHAHAPHGLKVLDDEIVHLSTAQSLFASGRLGLAPWTLQDDGQLLQPIDQIVPDKRGFLYPVLIAGLHAFSGFRLENGWLVNLLLTPLLVWATFGAGRRVGRRWGGVLAVLLLCQVPIFAQTFTGSSAEPLNLLLIIALFNGCSDYWRRPQPSGLLWISLLAAALSMTRYESPIFALAVAVIVGAVAWRDRRVELSWAMSLVPWLFLPCVWLFRMISGDLGGALQENQSPTGESFAFTHLPGNLKSLFIFLFNFPDLTWDSSRDWWSNLATWWRPLSELIQLGSPWLGALGLLGGTFFVMQSYRLTRRRFWASSNTGVPMAIYAIGLPILLILLAHLCFFWGIYTRYEIMRLSLPWLFLLLLLAVWAISRMSTNPRRQQWWWRGAAIGTVLMTLNFTVPVLSYSRLERNWMPLQRLQEIWAWLDEHESGPIGIISRSPHYPNLKGIWAGSIFTFTDSLSTAAHHWQAGRLKEVYVIETWERLPNGEWRLDDGISPFPLATTPVHEVPLGAGYWLRVSRIEWKKSYAQATEEHSAEGASRE